MKTALLHGWMSVSVYRYYMAAIIVVQLLNCRFVSRKQAIANSEDM